jgi:hypothetical protein
MVGSEGQHQLQPEEIKQVPGRPSPPSTCGLIARIDPYSSPYTCTHFAVNTLRHKEGNLEGGGWEALNFFWCGQVQLTLNAF